MMRTTLTATMLLTLASIGLGQDASTDADAAVLTIRLSADGICYFLDTSTSCDNLGPYLLSKHGDVRFRICKNSKVVNRPRSARAYHRYA